MIDILLPSTSQQLLKSSWFMLMLSTIIIQVTYFRHSTVCWAYKSDSKTTGKKVGYFGGGKLDTIYLTVCQIGRMSVLCCVVCVCVSMSLGSTTPIESITVHQLLTIAQYSGSVQYSGYTATTERMCVFAPRNSSSSHTPIQQVPILAPHTHAHSLSLSLCLSLHTTTHRCRETQYRKRTLL